MVPTTPPPTTEDSKWDLYNQSPFYAEDDFTNISASWLIKRILLMNQGFDQMRGYN
jgi:hypothetical protein